MCARDTRSSGDADPGARRARLGRLNIGYDYGQSPRICLSQGSHDALAPLCGVRRDANHLHSAAGRPLSIRCRAACARGAVRHAERGRVCAEIVRCQQTLQSRRPLVSRLVECRAIRLEVINYIDSNQSVQSLSSANTSTSTHRFLSNAHIWCRKSNSVVPTPIVASAAR